MASTKIIPINDNSDGDSSHRPGNPAWKLVDPPTTYLEKLAVQWLQAQGKQLTPGVTYRLDRLPRGYALFEKPRNSGAKLSDKRLFGSHRHKFFDSPNRFFPHFLQLMKGEPMVNCPCTVCNASGSQALPMRGPSGQPGPKRFGKPAKKTTVPPIPNWTDEEQVPDTLRILIDKLKRQGRLSEAYREEFSMDWRAERNVLPKMLDTLQKQPSFVPRVGELVLFVSDLDTNSEICREDETGQYKVFDTISERFGNHPQWQAGVVAQVGPAQLQDILGAKRRQKHETIYGFRIEPLPAIGDKNKSLSKKYKYVPLSLTRPFVFWPELLRGIPQPQWHPTVLNALTASASFSLVEKDLFEGRWPKANVYCKGVYMGSELWITGDAVRILPENGTQVTDILQIQSIALQLSNLDKATTDDTDDGHPYNSSIFLIGKIYTVDSSRALEQVPLGKRSENNIPPGLQGYQLYPGHNLKQTCKVPLSKILGRCFEAEALRLWFAPSPEEINKVPPLDYGLKVFQLARNLAKEHDRRIPAEKSLYWANSRGEALDINEMNGVLLSGHDPERDEEKLDGWIMATKMLSNAAGKLDKYKLSQKAHASSKDTALPTIEASAEDQETNAQGGPVIRVDSDSELSNMQNTGRSLALASATPSDELQDDDEESVAARFGLASKSNKRSRSISRIDDPEEGSSASEDGAKAHISISDDSSDEEAAGIKGVARSFAIPIARIRNGLSNALGSGENPDNKRRRTDNA